MPLRRAPGPDWKGWIFENGSYKLVALFVTLILWVTILGRRDFVLSKDMDMEFLLPRTLAVKSPSLDRRVTVKVSGPRMALKKFAQNPGTITIDLAKSGAGPVRATITPRSVEVPFGVKVVSVVPDVVDLTLVPVGADGSTPADPPRVPKPEPQPIPQPGPFDGLGN